MNLSLILFRKSAAHSKGRIALITFSISLGVAMILSFSAFVEGLTNTEAQDLTAAVYNSDSLKVPPAENSDTRNGNTDIAEETMNPESDTAETGENIVQQLPANAVLAVMSAGSSVQRLARIM
ncbi:hypothetical protein RQN30_12020 [Arcanobacterium hippocoleae]